MRNFKSPATDKSNTGAANLTAIVADQIDAATSRIVQAAANGDQITWGNVVNQAETMQRRLTKLAQLIGSFANESDRIIGAADNDAQRTADAVRLRAATMTVMAQRGWF